MNCFPIAIHSSLLAETYRIPRFFEALAMTLCQIPSVHLQVGIFCRRRVARTAQRLKSVKTHAVAKAMDKLL